MSLHGEHDVILSQKEEMITSTGRIRGRVFVHIYMFMCCTLQGKEKEGLKRRVKQKS